MEDIKRNKTFRSFRGASINRKLTGISVLKVKGSILKKINVSFIVHFCLGQYRSSLDIFLHIWLYKISSLFFFSLGFVFSDLNFWSDKACMFLLLPITSGVSLVTNFLLYLLQVYAHAPSEERWVYLKF